MQVISNMLVKMVLSLVYDAGSHPLPSHCLHTIRVALKASRHQYFQLPGHGLLLFILHFDEVYFIHLIKVSLHCGVRFGLFVKSINRRSHFLFYRYF